MRTVFGLLIVTAAVSGLADIFDSSTLLSAQSPDHQVPSKAAKDILEQYRMDLDALSTRLGATTFGAAENVSMTQFQSLQCCYPEVPAFVPES